MTRLRWNICLGLVGSPRAKQATRSLDFPRLVPFLTRWQAIQGTKPQSLSYGLWDSPIALLAWIREKMQTWSDSYPWTDEEVITWVMIYWISQVTGGLRIYKEGNVAKVISGYVHVPFGVSVFPKELFVAPKGTVRRLFQCLFIQIGHGLQEISHFTAITIAGGTFPIQRLTVR